MTFTLDFFRCPASTVRTSLDSANTFNCITLYGSQITSLSQSNNTNDEYIILCNFGDRSMNRFGVTERGFWSLPLRQVAGLKKKPGLNRVKEFEFSPSHNVLLYPMLCHRSVGLHCGR